MRGWKLFFALYGAMAGLAVVTGFFARFSPQGRQILKLIRPGEVVMAAIVLTVIVGGFVWLNKLMDEEQARRGK